MGRREGTEGRRERGGELFDRILLATPKLMLEAPVGLEVVYDADIEPATETEDDLLEAIRMRRG